MNDHASSLSVQQDGDEFSRVMESARDALSDDIVQRLSATIGQGLDLLDQFNRSGLADALPVFADMARNGDLQRLAETARLLGAAQDALSDDIVSRLAQTGNNALSLMEQIDQDGAAQALTALKDMAESGDIQRVVDFVRLTGAMQDALSDDIVTRFANVLNELLCLGDRIVGNANTSRLLDTLLRDDVTHSLCRYLEILSQESIQTALLDTFNGLAAAHQAAHKEDASRGGLSGMLALTRSPEMQDALQLIVAFRKGMRNGSG